jgi:hypothetical protein
MAYEDGRQEYYDGTWNSAGYDTTGGKGISLPNARGEYSNAYGYSTWADKESSDKFWAQNREDQLRSEDFNRQLTLANNQNAWSGSGGGTSSSGSGGGGNSSGWGNGSGFNSSDSTKLLNMLRDSGYGLASYTPIAAPTFTAPEYNKSGYKPYANEMAAGPNRELSRIIQKVVLSSYGKPAPLARMNTSAALEKGAEGFANIGAKATEYGQRQYETEYNRAFNAAMANFNAQNQNINIQNQAGYNKQQTMASTIMNSYMMG